MHNIICAWSTARQDLARSQFFPNPAVVRVAGALAAQSVRRLLLCRCSADDLLHVVVGGVTTRGRGPLAETEKARLLYYKMRSEMYFLNILQNLRVGAILQRVPYNTV